MSSSNKHFFLLAQYSPEIFREWLSPLDLPLRKVRSDTRQCQSPLAGFSSFPCCPASSFNLVARYPSRLNLPWTTSESAKNIQPVAWLPPPRPALRTELVCSRVGGTLTWGRGGELHNFQKINRGISASRSEERQEISSLSTSELLKG